MKGTKKTVRTAVLLIGLAAVPATAVAQGDTGFYLGASVGQTKVKAWRDVCNELDTLASCDDKDTSWRIFGGYQFHRNFALELGYIDFGKVSASGTELGFPASASGIADAIDFVGVGIVPLADRFSLYGKVGIFRWDTTVTTRIAGVPITDRENGRDWTYGIGLKYDFTRNIAGRLEFQRYNNVGEEATTGQTDVNVWSIGLKFRF